MKGRGRRDGRRHEIIRLLPWHWPHIPPSPGTIPSEQDPLLPRTPFGDPLMIFLAV